MKTPREAVRERMQALVDHRFSGECSVLIDQSNEEVVVVFWCG
ncbi:MAG TPA: hypothetical protein PLG17_00780 [Thermodesulfobacteriota bacterium]|nr:hypothetical protein [Thermodesulfobacteriota bacterium]HQO77025.1 hypothetical protein [Thermodesulfobacteriota bacterium]